MFLQTAPKPPCPVLHVKFQPGISAALWRFSKDLIQLARTVRDRTARIWPKAWHHYCAAPCPWHLQATDRRFKPQWRHGGAAGGEKKEKKKNKTYAQHLQCNGSILP